MIQQINLENFKCHAQTKVNLRNLTLLLGTNSSGKSSVIQSLLLAIHNISSPESSPLNGHLVSIGSFNEARNIVQNARKFSIEIADETSTIKFDFDEGEELDYDGKMQRNNSPALEHLLDYTNKNIHYLSANRIGGQDLYTKNFDKYDQYGIFGEYAIDYYEHHKVDVIPDDLQVATESRTLESQVNYWLGKILNHSIGTAQIQGTDKVKAEYYQTAQKGIRPKNTGSGVSYVISILIVCLSSKPGEVVIIENPEIHLHPKAQSELVDFFVLIANAGIQLIIETHSDHIFNGVRVNAFQKTLSIDKLSVNFFTLDDTFQTKHTLIGISENGRINNPQELLFDQFENDLNTLLGL